MSSFRVLSSDPPRPTMVSVGIVNGVMMIPTSAGGVIAKTTTPIDNTQGPVNFTIKTSGSGLRIGDQLFLLLEPAVPGGYPVAMTFSEKFFFTQSVGQIVTIDLETLSRWCMIFVWDGSAFVDTSDAS
jgi:hypothetical protein